jgi:hypothetical protein
MSGVRLAGFTFIVLAGDPPEFLGLAALPPARETYSLLERAVRLYLEPAVTPRLVDDLQGSLESPHPGLHLVYVMGHAWPTPGGLQVAVIEGGLSQVIAADEFCRRLALIADASDLVLVFDTCHAARFRVALENLISPRCSVFVSAPDEAAIAFPFDRTTRFALTLSGRIAQQTARDELDLIRTFGEVADDLRGDGVVPGQTVDYDLHGPRLILTRGQTDSLGRPQRTRTVSLVRNALLVLGALGALGLAWIGIQYSQHMFIEVNLGDLERIANEIVVTASQEIPSSNMSRMIATLPTQGGRVRFWLPVGDVIVRVEARYKDNAPRALGFHLTLTPGLDPGRKFTALALPSVELIKAHPGMAFVPQTRWLSDEPRIPRINPSFWIDIAPPTVKEYLPLARALHNSGKVNLDEILLLGAEAQRESTEAVGLGQLLQLSRDLADVFAVIDATNLPYPTGRGDIVVGALPHPCDTCPAPMTYTEAVNYCRLKGKRVPSNFEWELATRGVDGRIFPWGDRFDSARAYAPGLPQKDEPAPKLQPVNRYAHERSPFGLIDTVGNAGDWVEDKLTGFERSFMGATYRYNPEDATTFRLTPITLGEIGVLKEITVRCAAN